MKLSIHQNLSIETLIQQAWRVRTRNFPARIQFVYPKRTRSISITGTHCELNCAHCGGHYLKGMLPLPENLGNLDYDSFLISGGCDKNGKVPIHSYIQTLKKMKQNRHFNLHVGLLDEKDMEGLEEIADVISFDFVGDNATIREIYGLEKTVEDYLKTYRLLKKHAHVVPHICIGLKGGMLSGEFEALESLKREGVDELVFIIFIPTHGTKLAHCPPPSIEDVLRVLATARIIFPDIPIHLGCMRPGGVYRKQLDPLALRCGINKLVVPAPQAKEEAINLGLTIELGEECCAL